MGITRGVIRSVFLSALALTLTACTLEGNPHQIFFKKQFVEKCVAETGKNQAPVNWDRAKVFNLGITDGIYEPNETYMKVGQPTILRIANNDSIPRYFIDGEFLDSVALAQMSIGGVTYDRPCISGVVIDAGKKAEFRLVPLAAGIYFPKDPFWFLGFQPGKFRYIYVNN